MASPQADEKSRGAMETSRSRSRLPLKSSLLVAGACLGWAAGCSSNVGAPIPTNAPLAIAGARGSAPVDGAKEFTHLALVIDTSSSMRDPATGKLWPVVTQAVVNVLATHPEIGWIQWIDTNGRGRLGPGNEWMPYDRRSTDELVRLLEQAENAGVSDPVSGLVKALNLPLPQGPNERMHICVLGDEAGTDIAPALREIGALNRPNGSGGWRATISGVHVPTIGFRAQTALNFESLMAELARRHGGTYVRLADLHRL